ncbi:hypothetical protein [Kaarinaea lacus]
MKSKDKQALLDEQLFLTAAKSTLEKQVDQIDDQLKARLAAARRQAVDGCSTKPSVSTGFSNWIMPAGGLAIVGAALLVAVTLWTMPVEQNLEPVAVLEDINLLTGSEDIDFYQELEFYEWLAVNEQAVS